jgi:O-antigen/teichoic acid export membrane protein
MTKYIKGVALTYSTQLLVLCLTFLINVVIVRTLGASGKGIISLLQMFFQMLVLIAMFGMSEGNTYYLGNRRYKHRDVLSSTLFHTVVVSLFVVFLAIVLRKWLATTFLRNIDERYFLVALGIFPAFFLFQHGISMLLGHKQFVSFNIAGIARNVSYLLLLLFLIPKYDLKGAILASILGLAVADVIIYGKLIMYGVPRVGANFDFLKKAFTFGAKSQVGLLLSQINRRLDIFIINIFLTPAQVGYYAIAVAMAELPWHISQAAATVLFPEISGMEKEKAHNFTAFVCRNVVFLIFCFSIMLLLVGGILVTAIFGRDFGVSVMPLQILLPGIILLSINKVLCAGFSGTGKPQYGTYTATIAAITTIALDFLLIPLLGIRGAAIASTAAYFAAALTAIVLFKKQSRLSLSEFLLIKGEDIKKYPILIKKFKQRIKRT